MDPTGVAEGISWQEVPSCNNMQRAVRVLVIAWPIAFIAFLAALFIPFSLEASTPRSSRLAPLASEAVKFASPQNRKAAKWRPSLTLDWRLDPATSGVTGRRSRVNLCMFD
jgi:hypothetical protein